MTKKKKENIMTCPRCGADLNGAENPARLPKTAQERIEALRLAGVDVSHLFAMQGANGGDYVASNQDGKLTILDDNDPIFSYITSQGDAQPPSVPSMGDGSDVPHDGQYGPPPR